MLGPKSCSVEHNVKTARSALVLALTSCDTGSNFAGNGISHTHIEHYKEA